MNFHETTFTHGDIVYLKTDPHQLQRMVVTLRIFPGGAVLYELACGPESSSHFEIEISRQENAALRLGLNEEAAK